MLGAPFVGPSHLMTTSQWYKPLSISHVEISNCVSSPLKNPSGAPVIVSDNVKVFVTLTFVVISVSLIISGFINKERLSI